MHQESWRHITFRHPELKNGSALILFAVAHPDEVYVDSTGAFHALKRVNEISDFLVVIYTVNGAGYKRTPLNEYYKKIKEVPIIQKVKTLLDTDARKVLEQVEQKYCLKPSAASHYLTIVLEQEILVRLCIA